MILYLESSALVKRYFEEPFSQDVISHWIAAEHIVTSSVTYAEALACIHRKRREARLDDNLTASIIGRFHRDWNSFIRIEVNDELNEYINRAVREYPLRGFDAIHFASAMIINEKVTGDVVFACFDDRLLLAVQSEGLGTLPTVK